MIIGYLTREDGYSFLGFDVHVIMIGVLRNGTGWSIVKNHWMPVATFKRPVGHRRFYNGCQACGGSMTLRGDDIQPLGPREEKAGELICRTCYWNGDTP